MLVERNRGESKYGTNNHEKIMHKMRKFLLEFSLINPINIFRALDVAEST
jgi:hypothetical protein